MASQSNANGSDNFSIMQHLIEEMDASNHRIDMFSQKFDDDVNKFQEPPPPKRSSKMERQFEALYDDAWKSEESDGASLQEVPAHLSNDAEDSGCEEVVNSAIAEVSNDFLSGFRQTTAQNQYVDSDDSRISSDNDFKILRGMASYARYPETTTGLSDTDWNPYGTESDNNQSPRLHPQENGSDSKSSLFTSFTPLLNSTDINTVTPNSGVRFPQLSEERMSDILERTERESTLSSHLTQNTRSDHYSSDSTIKQLYSPAAIRRKPEQKYSYSEKYEDKKGSDASNSKEGSSSDEEKKLIASTSSTGYSSAPTSVKAQDHGENMPSKPLSVIERAKLMGVPEEILLDKRSKTKLSKTGEFHRKFCDSPENVVNLSDDQLGQKVKALLSDTTHLSTYDKTDSGSSVDYTVLQRDLQEIQDNLDNFGVGLQGSAYDNKTNSGKCKSQASSEGDMDIIPSTTTTPEKRKEKMLWDFAGDLGSLSEHPGLMAEISLDTRSSSNRPSTEKPYNSDGDSETRTSESSARNEDHADADQALADMCEILPPSMRNLDTSTDVDKMVSTFQNQRRQLESRYQELNNQGLAQKVFRILTNQDPESHANGILSEISADEKDMRTRMVLDMHDKNFNYSSTSSWLDDVNQSFNPNCDVRKKLDMSGLSSRDSSWILGKPSTTKGFSAIDDAKRLLSSQMLKASERTFNHSIEMRVPQTIQCYPLFVGDEDGHASNKEETNDSDEKQRKDYALDQETGHSLQQNKTDSSDTSQQEAVDGNGSNTSPTDFEQRSSLRSKDKYIPYRPAGSKQVYYIESDTASVADSVTTMESTHIGSDDAKGPALPSHAFGSRRDPPGAGTGIYSSQDRNLSTVCEDTELATIDEKTERNDSKSSSKNEPQSSYLSHKHSAKKGDQPAEPYDNKRHDASSIEAARRDAKWAHRREEIDKESQAPDFREGRRNVSPSHGMERRTYDPPSYGIDRTANPGIDAARRDAKWAHRYEEMSREGRAAESERRRNASPVHEIEGASRDARWSRRDREMDRESRAPDSERRRDASPAHGIEAARRDARWNHRKDEIDKEVSRANDEQENEPISLRIRMSYSGEKNEKDRMKDLERDGERQRFPSEREQTRDAHSAQPFPRDTSNTFGRCSPELKNALISSFSNPYYDQGLFRAASDENLNPRHGNLSPAFRSALDSGLVRAGSDENLNSSRKDARLSPAFRRALSPDLRNSIERRSPLLSRHIERSLAQPPSEYPGASKVCFDDGRFDRRGPPTFLARERSLSPPTSRVRHPFHDNSDSLNRERPSGSSRPRSASPPYLERISRRIGSPVGRQNEAEQFEPTRSHRVLDSQEQPSIKSKRKVELTLEGMSSESDADLEVDQEPLTKRTQLLKAALSNEGEPQARQDINAMWERFKAMNESGSSSINSSKIEAVADLLKSPSRHLVSQYVKDREEYRIERQERAEIDREKRLREQQMHKHSSSEDEINERYAELLALKEEERMKRRVAKKKKGKTIANATAETRTERDNLFSIPEDRSHDPSPSKPTTTSSSKHQKAKGARQTHVIDPNMFKLRERIAKQKTKVDKDMLKEMRRIEKLNKLESLLSAKTSCKISNETLQSQLDELSSTSAIVSDSHESCTDIPSNFQALSDDSTTAKDSSAEMHARKAEKERRKKLFQSQKQPEGEKKPSKEKNSNHSKKSLYPSGSKSSPDVSEIRLLKLVKEGYLTATEAYKLAVDRATQDGPDTLDVSRDSSNNSDNGSSGKPHKLYSPYSRSSSQTSQMRHVPKLKYSGSLPHSSYGVEDEDLHQQFMHEKERKLQDMLSDQRHRARGRVERRPKSHSPSHGTAYSPIRREKSFSPSSAKRSTQPTSRQQRYNTSPSGRSSLNPHDQYYSKKVKRNLQESKKYRSENDLPRGHKEQDERESVAWHIPMDLPSRQWKEPPPTRHKQSMQPQQPLREVTSFVTNNKHHKMDKRSDTATQGFYNTGGKTNLENQCRTFDNTPDEGNSIWKKSSHPRGIPKLQWEQVVSSDALASKTNHWEVDPMMDRVQYILNKPGSGNSYRGQGDLSQRSNMSQDSDSYEKPISKMSLQEAFFMRKQRFISKCSERQKRMKLAKDDRQLQECLRLEREAIFAEQQRLAPPNLYAHPYSDNLHHPKNRILTKQEMKSLTARIYNKLPEVVGKKEDDKKKIEAKLNRLRASLFNKKVQRDVLRKTLNLRC